MKTPSHSKKTIKPRDEVTQGFYSSIHKWLRESYGKANHCSDINCNETCKTYEYALKKGKKYEKRLDNFICLCKKCHVRYDWREDTSLKMSIAKKNVPRPDLHKSLAILTSRGRFVSAYPTVRSCMKAFGGNTQKVWHAYKNGEIINGYRIVPVTITFSLPTPRVKKNT